MHDVQVDSTDAGRIERKTARYQLATLLTKENFAEAKRLSSRWLQEHVIEPSDYDFVQEILERAEKLRGLRPGT